MKQTTNNMVQTLTQEQILQMNSLWFQAAEIIIKLSAIENEPEQDIAATVALLSKLIKKIQK